MSIKVKCRDNGFKLASKTGPGIIANGSLKMSAQCSAEVRKASGMLRIAGKEMENRGENVRTPLNKSVVILNRMQFQSPHLNAAVKKNQKRCRGG